MKILISVVNCHSRHLHRQAVRDTWLPLVQGADVKFFLGRGATREPLDDEVFLDCSDEYESLPEKVRAITSWALLQGYTHMLKCDDDVILVPSKLMTSGFQYRDFTGHKNDPRAYPVPFGFCYWMSQKSMQLVAVAELPTDGNDEVWVTNTLSKAGIVLHNDNRYVMHTGRRGDFVPSGPRPLRAPPRTKYVPEEFPSDSDIFARCMFIVGPNGYGTVPHEKIIAEMHRVHQNVNS